MKLLPEHFTHQPLAESIVEAEVLDSFTRNGTPAQDISRPQLVWDMPWTHPWNAGMIFKLAGKFVEEVKNKSRPLLAPRTRTTQSNILALEQYASSLTVKEVQDIIHNKLSRTRTAYRTKLRVHDPIRFEAEWSKKMTEQSTKERHLARRTLVSGSIRTLVYVFIFSLSSINVA